MVIRDSPSAFVTELLKLPYSEVLFREYRDDFLEAEMDAALGYEKYQKR